MNINCTHCGKEMREEDGLYLRTTAKFFCSFACLEIHHHRPTGVVDAPENNPQLFLDYEHPTTQR